MASITVDLEARAVAREMADNSFGMDVLAELADDGDEAIAALCDGYSGSTWHEGVAPFLRKLADALDVEATK